MTRQMDNGMVMMEWISERRNQEEVCRKSWNSLQYPGTIYCNKLQITIQSNEARVMINVMWNMTKQAQVMVDS